MIPQRIALKRYYHILVIWQNAIQFIAFILRKNPLLLWTILSELIPKKGKRC